MDPNASNPLTSATLIDDVRTVFITRDHQSYIPVNYDGKEHGKVTVREALASSLNIPAVRVLNQIGLERFASFMKTLGIQSLGSPDRYDLTIALGGGGVHLLELTAAYGAFANKGIIASPYWIESISDSKGNIYYQVSQKTRKVLDERVAWLISDILSDDQSRYIGFGKNSVLNLDRPAAVKTGTTTDFHDNWTIGYTPSLVVGVWVGNADYEPMVEVTGLTGAAPIWHEFTRAVLTNRPAETFQRPEGLIRQTFCKTLHPHNHYCQKTSTEWFIIGTQPELNASSSLIPKSSVSQSHFSVLSPRQNGVYLLPYTFHNSPKLLIELKSHSEITQFEVFIDGVHLATLETEPWITWWEMQEGKHSLRIKGWQGAHLVEEQIITFIVQPPLR
jgi:membrane peptidoglycan carboxypeptidase